MTFVLNKDMRRRRLADEDKAGAEGQFAYNMRSGRCIQKDDSDTSCGTDGSAGTGKKDGEDSFALWFSFLALFALY